MANKFSKAMRGLGAGLAQSGQMLMSDALQKARDERLAKLSEAAADKKYARDVEMQDKQLAATASENQKTRDANLQIAETNAEAEASKRSAKWKRISKVVGEETVLDAYQNPKTVKKYAEFFANEETGISVPVNGRLGKVMEAFMASGADMSTAHAMASQRVNEMDSGQPQAAQEQPIDAPVQPETVIASEPPAAGGIQVPYPQKSAPAPEPPKAPTAYDKWRASGGTTGAEDIANYFKQPVRTQEETQQLLNQNQRRFQSL